MRMPDGRSAVLYSIFEAVSNSLHAIEDRFGLPKSADEGKVLVNVALKTQGLDKGSVEEIEVSDNGVGLTDTNLLAFETCDSRNKVQRGGKGIGRLLWLKVFGRVDVESTATIIGESKRTVRFQFSPNQEDTLTNRTDLLDSPLDIGTQVSFSEVRPDYAVAVRWSTVVKELALHFFSYFVTKTMPQLVLNYQDHEPIDVRQYIESKITQTEIEAVTVTGIAPPVQLSVTHIYVEKSVARDFRNSILLIAHSRQVVRIEIEKKFALNKLSERRAYIAVVQGTFLDERVDQERTGFKMTAEQFDAIHDSVLSSAEKFLAEHIASLRQTQRKTVEALLMEHPQLAIKVADVEAYVQGLSPGMEEEDIGKSLFTVLYRDERKLAKEVAVLKDSDLSEEVRVRAQDTLKKVGDQARVRLAEYVVKRRQILDLVHTLLGHTNSPDAANYQEKVIHDLICPMGAFYDAKDYEAHNLWIVDDLLAYYSYFASDKQIKKIASDSEDKAEPDVVFFNPLGFRRSGTSDPVVLIEFKRPGKETPGDPVDQVLQYIEKLRKKTVKHAVTGQVISEVNANTPFQCYVVCDLTEGAKQLFERSVACYPTPDGLGYFGYAPRHNAVVHVISYTKMLHDAEARNLAFFDLLGLKQ